MSSRALSSALLWSPCSWAPSWSARRFLPRSMPPACLAARLPSLRLPPAIAVALALPVFVFLQVWRNFCYAVPGAFACKKIETALANRDLAKANLYHLTVVPLSIGIPSALLVFCSLFFGADLINNALNAIPQFVMDGLNVASGVMVCIGFALLIQDHGRQQASSLAVPGIHYGHLPQDGRYRRRRSCHLRRTAPGLPEGSSGPQTVAADEEEDF